MQKNRKRVVGALTVSLLLFSGSLATAAPKPVAVDAGHYRGTWLEIGRMPMLLTDGCVAGYSTYRQGSRPMKCWSKMAAAKARRGVS